MARAVETVSIAESRVDSAAVAPVCVLTLIAAVATPRSLVLRLDSVIEMVSEPEEPTSTETPEANGLLASSSRLWPL